ncbi:hypothetical protein L208DRAFT_1233636 [Tricholoma matsutake]|nr:hypothetical protein L208DRAFT_1233636 [Tricholoma matsutake 945]
MFGTSALTVLFTALVAHAIIVPSVPGPGVIYKTGDICHLEWTGDQVSTNVWQNTTIELMTGSNFGMIHLTTVATGQNGNVNGFFDHTCPDVTPNSAIYFYQFTNPNTLDKTWTTRFTIAGTDGSSVPPANTVQPVTGAKIPWGVGALKDSSTAVPPPAYLASSTSLNNATVPVGPSSIPTSTPASSTISSSTTTLVVLNTPPASSQAPTTVNSTTTNNQQSAAMGSIVVDNTVWGAALVLAFSALGFSAML